MKTYNNKTYSILSDSPKAIPLKEFLKQDTKKIKNEKFILKILNISKKFAGSDYQKEFDKIMELSNAAKSAVVRSKSYNLFNVFSSKIIFLVSHKLVDNVETEAQKILEPFTSLCVTIGLTELNPLSDKEQQKDILKKYSSYMRKIRTLLYEEPSVELKSEEKFDIKDLLKTSDLPEEKFVVTLKEKILDKPVNKNEEGATEKVKSKKEEKVNEKIEDNFSKKKEIEKDNKSTLQQACVEKPIELPKNMSVFFKKPKTKNSEGFKEVILEENKKNKLHKETNSSLLIECEKYLKYLKAKDAAITKKLGDKKIRNQSYQRNTDKIDVMNKLINILNSKNSALIKVEAFIENYNQKKFSLMYPTSLMWKTMSAGEAFASTIDKLITCFQRENQRIQYNRSV